MTTELPPTPALPLHTSSTATLPGQPDHDRLPRPGAYAAAADHCITELTYRIGPLVTLRRRADVEEVGLTVAPDPADCVLNLALGGDALGGELLTFVSTAIEPVAGGTRLRVPGSLGTGDASLEPLPATLLLRVVERTDASLLVVGTARVPYDRLHRTTGFALSRTRPARHLGLLVAAEFTCTS
ncbi:hypothetical protein ACWGLF_18340 [Streptomyces puniciscabiei]